ncbi:MAG: SRPBCC family protein [Acidimicrobiales bacterium]
MELNSEFEVDRPIDQTWALLTDVERIAPCLPGAQLEEIEGDEYRGSVKVKVGPITANYKGKATFIEKDDAAHRAVLRAEGRDVRQGNANATITAQLVAVGSGTKVTVTTDLAVTGKVAQFGRGVMAEVSEKLLGQFVQNLETKVLAQTGPGAVTSADAASTPDSASSAAAESAAAGPAAGTAATAAGPATSADADGAAASSAASNGAGPGVRKIVTQDPVEPVDLLGATGAPMLKRLAPVLAGLFGLMVVGRWLRRRRR